MESTPSVAMYVRGVRATEAEVADTAESFSNLMGVVMTRANECNDPCVAFSGERESKTPWPIMLPLTRTHNRSIFAVSSTDRTRYAEVLHFLLLTVVYSICFLTDDRLCVGFVSNGVD